MSSLPEYVLPRDIADNNRINYHHFLWTSHFGYHLHPSIPLDNPNICIADVGTGTGIFLTDLASRLPPTATLEGLDISFVATAPSSWLSENVTFREWNIKDPEVPDDLVGVYDIIHIRHLVFVLTSEEVPGVIERLVKLLKPGGHIQWSEVDVSSHRVVTTPTAAEPNGGGPSTTIHPQKRLFDLTLRLDPRLSPTWTSELPTLFSSSSSSSSSSQAGGKEEGDDRDRLPLLEVVRVDKRDAESDPLTGFHMHECNLTLQELIAATALDDGGGEKGEILREIRGLMGEVIRTTREEGAAWGFDRWCVVGRKRED